MIICTYIQVIIIYDTIIYNMIIILYIINTNCHVRFAQACSVVLSFAGGWHHAASIYTVCANMYYSLWSDLMIFIDSHCMIVDACSKGPLSSFVGVLGERGGEGVGKEQPPPNLRIGPFLPLTTLAFIACTYIQHNGLQRGIVLNKLTRSSFI